MQPWNNITYKIVAFTRSSTVCDWTTALLCPSFTILKHFDPKIITVHSAFISYCRSLTQVSDYMLT